MIRLGENRYGKSRVRLVRVKRAGDRHDLDEWTVEVLLGGDFSSCFAEGDNSKILPTDTMKNTVYSLARTSSARCIEDFAKELTAFFVNRNPQVTSAEVNIQNLPGSACSAEGMLRARRLFNRAANSRPRRSAEGATVRSKSWLVSMISLS